MSRKPKFSPVITRIKLTPEQAVLACTCYSAGKIGSGRPTPGSGFCVANTRDEKQTESGTSGATS